MNPIERSSRYMTKSVDATHVYASLYLRSLIKPSSLTWYTSHDLRSVRKYQFTNDSREPPLKHDLNRQANCVHRLYILVSCVFGKLRKSSPPINVVDCIRTRLSINSGAVTTNAADKSNRCVRILLFGLKKSTDISKREEGRSGGK